MGSDSLTMNEPIKNFSVKFYAKDNHAPVFQNARSVSYQMKNTVEFPLITLEEDGTIEKVEFS